MKRISTALVISLSVVGIVVSLLASAKSLGILNGSSDKLQESRVALSECVGVAVSQAIQRRDSASIKGLMEAAVQRNGQLVSCRLTKADGTILKAQGPDEVFHQSTSYDIATVPVFSNGESWGSIDLAFVRSSGSLFDLSFLKLVCFMGAFSGLGIYLYLKKVLMHLDPSNVMPNRVRTTLDTLAEGLIVLDGDMRIVLANKSFTSVVDTDFTEFQGKELDEFDWELDEEDTTTPWVKAIESGKLVTGEILNLHIPNQRAKTFRVSCSPILNGDGNCQGALVSLDDVTALQARTQELKNMLERLKESRDHIREQNQQLVILATRDPLTGALNRRSLFEKVNQAWTQGTTLCCIMIDIDHFKSVNDNHGHAMGDLVLKETAALFRHAVRQQDIVGRYGGEEFCVVLPGADMEQAMEVAERIRASIESHHFEGLSVTASLGVAQRHDATNSIDEVVDLADKSLYVAKRTGRNRVISYLDLEKYPFDDAEERATLSRHGESQIIPFQTVSALTAALAYRDVATAQHSRRVANLSFEMASGLMSMSEAYILENAALLHDIGKIGVPDHILLKPGPLTQDEWEVMKTHDDIGVEIIASTFACEELTEIVRHHHTRFMGSSNGNEISGEDIPLGARILTIVDSYDAMVSDRVYRKGLSQADTFAELRRCSGRQFDPKLVDRFIKMMDAKRGRATFEPLEESVEKQAALHIGVQIEDLANAVDRKDTATLQTLAEEIGATAARYEIKEIANLANSLAESAGDNAEWLDVLQQTIQLIELCRQSQETHISVNIPDARGINQGRRATDSVDLGGNVSDRAARDQAAAAV